MNGFEIEAEYDGAIRGPDGRPHVRLRNITRPGEATPAGCPTCGQPMARTG